MRINSKHHKQPHLTIELKICVWFSASSSSSWAMRNCVSVLIYNSLIDQIRCETPCVLKLLTSIKPCIWLTRVLIGEEVLHALHDESWFFFSCINQRGWSYYCLFVASGSWVMRTGYATSRIYVYCRLWGDVLCISVRVKERERKKTI